MDNLILKRFCLQDFLEKNANHENEFVSSWKPCVAQGTHSYPAVYPRLVIFFPIKINPINLDSKTMLRTSPWFSRVPTNET